ncbi:MAG: preprotein translocase subunit SecG [Acidobacteriota bacterium]
MMFLLYSLHVLICFFLIAVVLLQQGKGADLSVFGGGATQTAFGARGAASVLHKLTVGFFVAFIATTLAIGVAQSNSSSSVIEGLPEDSVEALEEAEPEGALPTDDAAADAEAPSTEDAEGGDTEAPATESADGDAAREAGADDASAADASAETGDAADESGN